MKIRTDGKRAPLLGALELNVLEYIWHRGRGDAKGIHQDLHGRRRIALSTVQSTLDRLFRKGLLARSKVSHAYIYKSAVTREALIADMIRDIITNLAGGSLEPAVSGFIDLADGTDEETLEMLEQMIAQRRKKAGPKG